METSLTTGKKGKKGDLLICLPSDSTASGDAWVKPRTVATSVADPDSGSGIRDPVPF